MRLLHPADGTRVRPLRSVVFDSLSLEHSAESLPVRGRNLAYPQNQRVMRLA
jgi:hypothetical protein